MGLARDRLRLARRRREKMLLQQITSRIAAWITQRREIDKVRFLDDRLLADMGVERREIIRRVKGR
jgi:uncharacterized protein YjiS (DUF1127 family)